MKLINQKENEVVLTDFQDFDEKDRKKRFSKNSLSKKNENEISESLNKNNWSNYERV